MLPAADIHCPYCGETMTVFIDDSAGEQEYIEDCQICCRPISIHVAFDRDGDCAITATGENDA